MCSLTLCAPIFYAKLGPVMEKVLLVHGSVVDDVSYSTKLTYACALCDIIYAMDI